MHEFKRVTIPIDFELEDFKLKLEGETGMRLSYAQAISYLVAYYNKNEKSKLIQEFKTEHHA